jgi:hypothetical protein
MIYRLSIRMGIVDVGSDVASDADCVGKYLDMRYQNVVEARHPFSLEGGWEVVGGLNSLGLEIMVDLAAGKNQALIGLHGRRCRFGNRVSDVPINLQA